MTRVCLFFVGRLRALRASLKETRKVCQFFRHEYPRKPSNRAMVRQYSPTYHMHPYNTAFAAFTYLPFKERRNQLHSLPCCVVMSSFGLLIAKETDCFTVMCLCRNSSRRPTGSCHTHTERKRTASLSRSRLRCCFCHSRKWKP
jgi:hypothetical protein